MQKHFLQAMEKIEGLINLWSALSADTPVSDKKPAEGGCLLVAVSGGVDSMCLADLFLNKYGPDSIAMAHCNFCLRGEESDGDQFLVQNWAKEHGVLWHTASFDTEAYAVKEGISIEMAARDLRYSWFAQLCNDYGYTAVAVAHNANDNAETLILNLLRGTGLRGLSGMSMISGIPNAGTSGCADRQTQGMVAKPYLIRPILECTRKMIEGYAFVHKVPYRTDSTNASSDYKRNRIRNDIFPIFEKINPSFVRTLNREMGYFEEALEIVEDYCAQQSSGMAGLGRPAAECLISVPELLSHKHWRYLLYYMLEPYGFNAASLASVENLLESDRTISGKRFESPTHELVVERSNLCVRPISEEISSVLEQRNDEISGDAIMEVHCPGIYNFKGSRWQVEVMDREPDMPLKQPQGVLIADADKLAFPFVCRRWRHGDWMIPFGMKGRKKVSDIFADLKFTSHEKDQAVMIVDCRGNLADQQHIAGILGIRMDDRYKVAAPTKKIIRITLL